MTNRQKILAAIERKVGNELDDPNKLSLKQALEKVNEYERKHGYHSEMSYTTLKGYYDCNGGFRPSTEQRLMEGLGLC